MTVFGQDGYRVRLEWGGEGVTALAPHCAVLVVVDVLVFTTTVDVVVGRGARVLPFAIGDEAAKAGAEARGAIMAGLGLYTSPTGSVATREKWSLRPSSLTEVPAGTLLGLSSPNGGTLCARAAEAGAIVLAGCLRNASAVAAKALELAGDRPIGIIAGGERWRIGPERPLRPSLEDYLGAGAIAHGLRHGRSAEAELAATAFAAVADRVPELLAHSVSGRELAEAGMAADVELAGAVDSSTVAPVLVDGIFGA
ncbi:2-phosphosulfolactate phosphatase [Crossiella cryophila]|uniref:Probable 2-phosphosulfolactate phosphatase n=1 Tax=Crossiella cryophila TaxID=43355 RepID=A0A7W7CAG1_9PSEU|nr:2-phosphosulfolactate phosphatase [Crossiella cryophila]MBB4676263.1 2-phosphosulfolactate phosphatase [Crossiella cryophila]